MFSDSVKCLVCLFYVLQEASSWDVLLPEAAQDIDQEFALRYGIEPIYRIMMYANHVLN